MVQQVKNPPAMKETQEAWGSISGSGRSPGEETSNPLQFSCLKNSTDRGATVQKVTKSCTQLNNQTEAQKQSPKFEDKLYAFYLLNVMLYQVIFHFSMKYI